MAEKNRPEHLLNLLRSNAPIMPTERAQAAAYIENLEALIGTVSRALEAQKEATATERKQMTDLRKKLAEEWAKEAMSYDPAIEAEYYATCPMQCTIPEGYERMVDAHLAGQEAGEKAGYLRGLEVAKGLTYAGTTNRAMVEKLIKEAESNGEGAE